MANTPHYNEGRYVCEVIEQAMGETGTGKSQFVLRFKVLGTPAADNGYVPVSPQYDRTAYMVITDKTIPYVVEKLKTLGYNRGSFRYLDPDTADFHSFAGQMVDMFCKHENNQNGELREKWDVARAIAPLSTKPIEPKKMRELDNLFGKHLKDLEQPQPQATVVGSRAVTPESPITDDDVPF